MLPWVQNVLLYAAVEYGTPLQFPVVCTFNTVLQTLIRYGFGLPCPFDVYHLRSLQQISSLCFVARRLSRGCWSTCAAARPPSR